LSEKRWDFVKETETHGGSHRIDDLLRSKEKLSSNYTNTRQPVPAFSLPHGPGARSVSTGDFTFFDLPLVLGPPTRPSFILFGRNHLSSLKLGLGLGRDACGNDEASFRLSMREAERAANSRSISEGVHLEMGRVETPRLLLLPDMGAQGTSSPQFEFVFLAFQPRECNRECALETSYHEHCSDLYSHD
jgi:hypothetical protein